MRRLFSSFARGWPGASLLLMRLVAAIALINQGILKLHSGDPIKAATLAILWIGPAVLLFVGLWTPVVGSLVGLVEVWTAFSHGGDPWNCILLGTIGVALALLGPGAWSVDAHLFGWKRIEMRDWRS